MRRLLVVAALLGLAALLVTRAEPLAPTVALETPVEAIGRATPVRVLARDRGSGLASVEIRVVPERGAPTVLASEAYPRRSFRGSGVHEAAVTTTLDAAAARLPEGQATLEVWAADHSWLALLRRGPRLAQPVTIDLTPPALEVTNEERVIRVGGSESIVYRAGADAVRSGVQVDDEFFPGVAGLFADPALRAALFALPQDAPDARPVAVAVDAAGNPRTVPVPFSARPQLRREDAACHRRNSWPKVPLCSDQRLRTREPVATSASTASFAPRPSGGSTSSAARAPRARSGRAR
jgi:hypothetical protein